jgi:hypothetical protein
MKNIESLTLAIKQEIIKNRVDSYCVYKGFNKRICQFREFWHGQITFPGSFNLSDIPTTGPTEVTVGFDALVLIDMDGNVKEQSYINGHFGPVTINYSNMEYHLDFSNSALSRLTT